MTQEILLPISAVKPSPHNSRTHSAKQIQELQASIREFGFTNPVLVDADNEVLAGHGRLEAAKALGMTEVPCRRLDHLTPAQRRAYRIADNRLALNADWDDAMLAVELNALNAESFDIKLLGFTDEELQGLLLKDGGNEGNTDPDAVPENVETKCKPGDLWQLGAHRLLCGDSTNAQHVERLMGGGKADLLLTDPPYGVSYVEKNAAVNGGIVKNNIGKQITNDSGTVEDMAILWGHLFSHADHFTEKASYYVFSPQGGELMMMMMQAIYQSKWKLKHSLIWQKQNFVFGRCDYHYQHEPVLYGWKKNGTHDWYADRSQSSLLQFDKPHRSDLHPTTKPVDLLEYLIGNSTKSGDLIVDLFLGSGSTLIACEKTGRRCFGIEIDVAYCDVILKRWEDFTSRQASLESRA